MAAYSLYDHGATPTLSTADTVDSAVTLGTTIKPTTSGQITSIWVYIGNTNAGGGSSSALIYNGASWADVPQSVLRQQAFTIQASVGWQEIVLNSPLSVVGGNLYIVAVFFPAGHYASTNSYFTVESTNGPLTALA